MIIEKPNFKNIEESLKLIQALTNASEAHGLLCALFSLGAEIKFTAWSNSLLIKTVEIRDVTAITALKNMKKFFFYTKNQFNEKDMNLYLFIPEDIEPISYRAEALTYWIKGFLSGIGLFGLDFENTKNKEIKEAINDLVKISYMDYEVLIKENNNEKDFNELLEYTKLAVLFISSQKV